MSQTNTVDRIKQLQGIWSKIQNFIGMGYATKEDLREADKMLRDNYYETFKELRHKWEEIYLAALENGLKGNDFKKVIQVMDRVTEKIHRADYGYAGLFDRKGSINEQGLANSLDFDKAFSADIEFFAKSVDELYKDYEAENWDSVPAKVKNLRSLMLKLDEKWNERENVFRKMEV